MKLNGNQPSAAEAMKSIDNNHLLQIQEIKSSRRGEVLKTCISKAGEVL